MIHELETRGAGEQAKCPNCQHYINLEHLALTRECSECNEKIRLLIEVVYE